MKQINLSIDNLDLQYFIDHSDASNFEDLEEYIARNGGFDVEIIYYASAIEYLSENDSSLQESLGLANERGFTLDNINSELLASLLASETVREEFYDNRTEIEEYYKSLND